MNRETIPVINPANETVIGHVARGTTGDVNAAVDAARSAFHKWRWIPGVEKGALLHGIAARIRARQKELATTMTLEGGKPFCENRDEVEWTASLLRLLRRNRTQLARQFAAARF